MLDKCDAIMRWMCVAVSVCGVVVCCWLLLGVWARPPELAQFVVSNVANDPKFEDIAKARVSGLRYLTAKVIGGKRAMQSYLEEVVYSQMIIE